MMTEILFTIDDETGNVSMVPAEDAFVSHVQLVAEFCLHYCCQRGEEGYEAKREEIERRSVTYRDM